MKKLFKIVAGLLAVLVIGGGGLLGYLGYVRAEELESQMPLSEKVAQTEASADFTPYDELPVMLVKATVSIEDRRFYDHEGIDYIGLVRALASQIFPDWLVRSGGSTIEQQVIKNFYGLFDTTLPDKVAEFILADRLYDEVASKDRIFALYVNIINYGDDYTGITEASWGYFGRPPLALTGGECTLLAGIPNSPSNFQLSDHFENARLRQQLVLQAMVKEGYITEGEAEALYEENS